MDGNGFYISKKSVTWLISIAASIVAIIIGTFAVCDRMEVQAARSFDQRFDKRYPVLHEHCANVVAAVQKKQEVTDSKVGNLYLAVKVLLMRSRQEMTYNQKEEIVEELVKNDSIPYDSAYKLLDQPALLRRVGRKR